jgi:TRAP-type uncharacterized transport system substrate-binding protein
MKPEAQQYIKLLKFDPSHPSSKRPLTIYAPSTVRAASYPNILKENFTTISVGAFLVTYDYNLQTTVNHLIRFSRALCENFATLQAKGHPKWKEVALELPRLNAGWIYYPPTTRELRSCIAAKTQAAKPRTCSPEEKVLGFCT